MKGPIGKSKRVTYSAKMAKAIASQGIYVEFSLILEAFSVQDSWVLDLNILLIFSNAVI